MGLIAWSGAGLHVRQQARAVCAPRVFLFYHACHPSLPGQAQQSRAEHADCDTALPLTARVSCSSAVPHSRVGYSPGAITIRGSRVRARYVPAAVRPTPTPRKASTREDCTAPGLRRAARAKADQEKESEGPR